MNGEKKQIQSLVRFTGKPRSSEKSQEKSRWKQFIAFINPFVKKGNKAIDLAEAYAESEVTLKENEAQKFSAEAAEYASRAELNKQEKVKLVNDEIERVFLNKEIPDQAKMLQLTNLLVNNPEILAQLEKIQDMMSVLKAVNFASFQLNNSKPKLISSEISEEDKLDEVDEVDEDYIQMRRLLKTPLSELDLSVRAYNSLKAADIKSLGDLASYNMSDLLKFRNFGKKTRTELEELIADKNLSFGMDVAKYKLDED